MANESTICIGLCKCGKYGQILDTDAEKEYGACHIDLADVCCREAALDALAAQAQELDMGY